MKIVSPTKKPITLRPIRPNAGLHAAYRKKIMALVKEMQDSLDYWLRAAYNAGEDPAMDSSEFVRKMARLPAKLMQEAMSRMVARWQKRFNEAAPKMAAWFLQQQKTYTDGTMQKILKDGGFSVEMTMTPAMHNVVVGSIAENVALIKSIGSQHLTQVEGLVMRATLAGRDIGPLAKELQAQYGVTQRRAAFIARDQANKVTSQLASARQQELGITQGRWRHSGAGAEPRPEHVAASGKLFDLKKGMLLEGEWVLPGQAINCMPGDSVIEFAAGCKKLWRRRYSGDLTELITASGKAIKATPNHPILTGRGWIPIQSVNVGDDVISIGGQVFNGVKADVQGNKSTFSEVFDAVSFYIGGLESNGAAFQFHGDASNGKVETVDIDCFLPDEIDSATCKNICELFFSGANHVLVSAGFDADSALLAASNRLFCAPDGVIRGFCALLPLLKSHGAHADSVCLGLSSDVRAAINKAATDDGARHAVALGKLKLATAGLVFGDDQVIGELFNLLSRASVFWYGNTPSADVLGKRVGANPERSGNVLERLPAGYELDSVVDKRVFDFCDHVYNLENGLNWYSSNAYIIHNCRCSWSPVIPGLED